MLAMKRLVLVLALALVSTCSDDTSSRDQVAPQDTASSSAAATESSSSVREGRVGTSNAQGSLLKLAQVSALVEAETPRFSRGVGFRGRLGIVVGGGCHAVGVVANQNGKLGTKAPIVVWPPGTTITATGKTISITSEGKTVKVGDWIEGGSRVYTDYSVLKKLLPEGCRNHPLRQVGLSP